MHLRSNIITLICYIHNQTIISYEADVSCSSKRREHVIRLELTTEQILFRLRHASRTEHLYRN